MYAFLVLLALLPGALAKPELLAIGAFNQAATGGFFHGGWWYVAVYAFIMWVTIGSALKRTLPQQEILAFLRDTAGATVAALLTTHAARCLFCLPQLLDVGWVRTVYYDHTDEETRWRLDQNRQARAKCQPVPWPCAVPNLFPQTFSYWAGPGLTLGAVIVVHGAYVLLGKFDDVYGNALAIGVTLVVLGGVAVFFALVDMFLRPAPWSHLRNNQQTPKYFLIALALFTIPVFYDSILPGGPLVRAAGTVGIYAGGWALFYLYATYLWPDNILYERPHHAFWFSVLGLLPNILGFIAGGVANDLYPGDSFNAFLSQVIAAAITVVFYILIRLIAYDGFTCCTDTKDS